MAGKPRFLSNGGPRRVTGSVLLLALTCATLAWAPLVSHRYVPGASVPDGVVAAHATRPDDARLTDVADASMATDHPLVGAQAVAAANEILRGRLVLPGFPTLDVPPEFSPDTLTMGTPVQQLWIGSLYVPDLLLRAYEARRDPAHLELARRYVRSFLRWDAARHWPVRYEWTAHATANRIAVLARFWKFTRADGDVETATLLHRHVARAAAMLAEPSQFVANTNYGVMQNLALVQISIAFPALPDAARLRGLAVERLLKQLPAYIDDDGMVLEHAAGYHFHGVVATGHLVRLLRAAGQPVPPALEHAFLRSGAVFAAMQRPDGSLPPYGNTFRYSWRLPPGLAAELAATPTAPAPRIAGATTFATAGLWISAGSSFDGRPVQAVVPWGYFPTNGHRRAQEASLLLWADGTDWTTNTGYWPNSDAIGAQRVEGWDGGNAPHLAGERADATRETDLVARAAADDIHVLDLVRSNADGATVRRQIVQLDRERWLVLDVASDPSERALRVLWTSAPETRWRADSATSFSISRRDTPVAMTASFAGPDGVSLRPLRGSREPFGGWVAFDRAAHPAPAIELVASKGRWLASAFELRRGDDTPAATLDVALTDAEHWTATLRDRAGQRTLQRDGATLRVQDVRGTRAVTLQPGPDASAARERIAATAADLRREFPRFREAVPERIERTALIAAFLLLSLAGMYWARRRSSVQVSAAIQALTLAGWTAAAVWSIAVPVGQ